MNLNSTSNTTTKGKLRNLMPDRYLIENETFSTDAKAEKGTYNTSGVRSGGQVPEFYIAHVDKYG